VNVSTQSAADSFGRHCRRSHDTVPLRKTQTRTRKWRSGIRIRIHRRTHSSPAGSRSRCDPGCSIRHSSGPFRGTGVARSY